MPKSDILEMEKTRNSLSGNKTLKIHKHSASIYMKKYF